MNKNILNLKQALKNCGYDVRIDTNWKKDENLILLYIMNDYDIEGNEIALCLTNNGRGVYYNGGIEEIF